MSRYIVELASGHWVADNGGGITIVKDRARRFDTEDDAESHIVWLKCWPAARIEEVER
jgi:hypothetical protein